MLGAGFLAPAAAHAVLSLGLVLEHLVPGAPQQGGIPASGQPVPQAEVLRDVHPGGAGHAVFTPGAAVVCPPAELRRRPGQQFRLLRLQGSEPGKGGQVLLHLGHAAHAAEDGEHTRQAGSPPKGPAGGSPLRPGGAEQLLHLLRRGGQQATLHRLHHHHRNAHALRQVIALQPRLLLRVQVVELELAEVPLPGGEDLLKGLIAVVEGEAQPADFPLPLQLLRPLHQALLLHRLPPLPIQCVEQVEVKTAGVQPLQLEIEDLLGVRYGLHLPYRQLGGQVIAVPGHARQGPAQKALALAVVVVVGGVKVVHPALQGPAEHAGRLRLPDLPLPVGGEAHSAEAQQGHPGIQALVFPIFHKALSCSAPQGTRGRVFP